MQKYNLQVTSFTRKSRKYSLYKDKVGKVDPNMLHRRFDELKGAIDKYIKYYNEQRIKEKLGWMSPVEYRLNLLVV